MMKTYSRTNMLGQGISRWPTVVSTLLTLSDFFSACLRTCSAYFAVEPLALYPVYLFDCRAKYEQITVLHSVQEMPLAGWQSSGIWQSDSSAAYGICTQLMRTEQVWQGYEFLARLEKLGTEEGVPTRKIAVCDSGIYDPAEEQIKVSLFAGCGSQLICCACSWNSNGKQRP